MNYDDTIARQIHRETNADHEHWASLRRRFLALLPDERAEFIARARKDIPLLAKRPDDSPVLIARASAYLEDAPPSDPKRDARNE